MRHHAHTLALPLDLDDDGLQALDDVQVALAGRVPASGMPSAGSTVLLIGSPMNTADCLIGSLISWYYTGTCGGQRDRRGLAARSRSRDRQTAAESRSRSRQIDPGGFSKAPAMRHSASHWPQRALPLWGGAARLCGPGPETVSPTP